MRGRRDERRDPRRGARGARAWRGGAPASSPERRGFFRVRVAGRADRTILRARARRREGPSRESRAARGRAETDRREVRERCALRVCREGCRAESQSLSVLTGRAFSRGRDHEDSAVQPAGRAEQVLRRYFPPFQNNWGIHFLIYRPSKRHRLESIKLLRASRQHETPTSALGMRRRRRLPRRRRATGCRSRDI